MRRHSTFTTSTIVAIALTAALAFTGCAAVPGTPPAGGTGNESGSESTDDNGTEELPEDSADDSVDIQLGGELPEDFPDEVPLVDGTVRSVLSTAGLSWTVTFSVDDLEASMNLVREQFTEAGFDEMMWENPYMETSIMGMFSTDDYLVSISTRPVEAEPHILYMVRKVTG